MLDQRFVDPGLQALGVGGVDEELGAVGLQEGDVLCLERDQGWRRRGIGLEGWRLGGLIFRGGEGGWRGRDFSTLNLNL